MSSWDRPNTTLANVTPAVATVAALTALPIPTGEDVYLTLGYWSAGDGGQGEYWWNSTDTRTANGVTIHQPDSLPAVGRWNLRYSGILNALQAGWLGDNGTDNTARIVAARDAIVAGEVIEIPPGIFRFTSFQIDKTITLRGTGWRNRINSTFGSAEYDDTSNYDGAILRSTATSGDAIAIAQNVLVSTLIIEDLLVMGPGSGTSAGIRLGSAAHATAQNVFDNVEVANFSLGWAIRNCFESEFRRVITRACSTGIDLIADVNNNQFSNIEIQHATVEGFKITAGAQNVVTNLLLQNSGDMDGTASIRHVIGDCNTFLGVWVENTFNTPPVVVDAATGLVILNLRIAGSNTDGDLTFNACDNALIAGYRSISGVGENDITFDASSQSCYFNGNIGNATVTDNGNNIIITSNGDMELGGGLLKLGLQEKGRVFFSENGSPAAPSAGNVVLFARNSGGKTQLAARFATGSVQQVAIEP